MENENPYRAPAAELIDQSPTNVELADRLQRFLAALVDGLIAMAIGVPTMILLGTLDYARRGQQPPYWLNVASLAIGLLTFVVINGYLLQRDGQTVGKKVVGTRIVALDNSLLPIGRLLALRYLPIYVVALIPFVGAFYSIVDVLFVFRDDRRCLHDLIAGTKVVKAT